MGFVRENLIASVGQWAAAVGVITAVLIILTKKASSSLTIGNLRAIAIALLCGGLVGAGAYGTCYFLNNGNRKAFAVPNKLE
jgi:hypothetical protein